MWKLSKEKKQELIKEYVSTDINCADLGRRYGISREAVRVLLKRRNIYISPNRPRVGSQTESYPDYEVIKLKRKT